MNKKRYSMTFHLGLENIFFYWLTGFTCCTNRIPIREKSVVVYVFPSGTGGILLVLVPLTTEKM